MKKALMVATTASMIKQFNMSNIRLLKEKGYVVDIACNFKDGNTFDNEKAVAFKEELSKIQINFRQLDFARSPFSANTFKSYRELKQIIKNGRYDIIHCHTPVAGILTRLAARKARKKGTRVIYTAHGFHFFKGVPKLNWMIYYPAEKLCSKYTDTLITINTEDFELAKKKFKAKEVKYIPGVGIDTEKFENITVDKQAKRAELGLSKENIVLLSVGELNENKNHHVIIEALGKINSNNIHYLIAGIGNKKEELETLAKELNVNLHLLGYRKDIAELCKISDVFCFPSKREGLGLAPLEAMSVGLPIITSDTRGINEYSEHGRTGYKCLWNDVGSFARAINDLIQDKQSMESFGKYNMMLVQKFDIGSVEKLMREIYGK